MEGISIKSHFPEYMEEVLTFSHQWGYLIQKMEYSDPVYYKERICFFSETGRFVDCWMPLPDIMDQYNAYK